MKVHFRKALDAGGAVFGPYLTPQIPAIYDLLADPQEKNDIMETTMSDGWAIGAAMGPVVAFQESAKTLPPPSRPAKNSPATRTGGHGRKFVGGYAARRCR
jgi:hypothetical protein